MRTRQTKAPHFDIHGRVMIRVDAKAPAAAQLQSMLACFATDTERPADIVVDDRPEPMPDAGLVEHELAYTANSGASRPTGCRSCGTRTSGASMVRGSCSPPWSQSSMRPW